MFIYEWLKSMWLWLTTAVDAHDSDSDASEEDPSVFRRTLSHNPDRGIFDDIDHVDVWSKPIIRPRPKREVHREDPEDNFEDQIVRLKNPYCVVIVNILFDNAVTPRNGAEADLKNLKKLLQQCAGFETVHFLHNKTRKETLEIMDHISTSSEIKKHDGLIVFISSHGRRKGILTVDKKIVEVDEMTTRVNGKQCEALRGKPKLFFISACRGKNTDPGISVEGHVVADASGDEKIVPRLPTEADFLICYATTLGYISHRRFALPMNGPEGMGTWLISSLTEIFEKNMDNEDVMHMLSRVNARVARMSSHGDHVDGMKQMPVQMHRLRYRVFLGNNQWK